MQHFSILIIEKQNSNQKLEEQKDRGISQVSEVATGGAL